MEVWLCGPRAFAEQLRSGFARAWLGRFHEEAFDMR
jgi:predicted ferric reductase